MRISYFLFFIFLFLIVFSYSKLNDIQSYSKFLENETNQRYFSYEDNLKAFDFLSHKEQKMMYGKIAFGLSIFASIGQFFFILPDLIRRIKDKSILNKYYEIKRNFKN